MAKSIMVEGDKATIGDTIGFKEDRERSGVLRNIKGRELIIDSYNDNTGDVETFYVDKDNCWME